MNGITRELIDQAGDAYGREGAEVVIAAFCSSMRFAEEALSLPLSAADIEVKLKPLGPNERAMAGGHDHGVLRFAFNTEAPVLRVVGNIPNFTIHEVSHLKHFFERRSIDWDPRTPFNTVIKEGYAAHVEATLLDRHYRPDQYQMLAGSQRNKMVRSLAEVLVADRYSGDYLTDLYEGRAGLDPYALGRCIVGMMSCLERLSINELTQVSFGEFRAFVETKL